MIYHLFLSKDSTNIEAFIDFMSEDKRTTDIDWNYEKTKVTFNTNDRINLLELFETLGIGDVEYYEESSEDDLRIHGQYVSKDKIIKEHRMLPFFEAGYKFEL